MRYNFINHKQPLYYDLYFVVKTVTLIQISDPCLSATPLCVSILNIQKERPV